MEVERQSAIQGSPEKLKASKMHPLSSSPKHSLLETSSPRKELQEFENQPALQGNELLVQITKPTAANPEQHLQEDLEKPSYQLRVTENEFEEEEPEERSQRSVPIRGPTIENWIEYLQDNIETPSALPSVVKTEFHDAKALFQSENPEMKGTVTLRQSKNCVEEISLLQFDPNFKSSSVFCRHPTCVNKNPYAAVQGDGVKRDLYLCPDHRELVESSICQAMEKEGINFPRSELTSEPGRFEGYTALISILEAACHKSELVKEAILNVRNFLIITSILLNPDDGNLQLALPPVYRILQELLETLKSPVSSAYKLVRKLLSLLKEVVDMILYPFGVIYTWVSLSNRGTTIGAIVGGIIGASGFVLGPAGGAVGATVGIALGGLLGRGIHTMIKGNRDQQNINRAAMEFLTAGNARADRAGRMKFFFTGNAKGALLLTAAAA